LSLGLISCASTEQIQRDQPIARYKDQIGKMFLVMDVCIGGSGLGNKKSLHLPHNVEIGQKVIDTISVRLATKGYSLTKVFPPLVGFSAKGQYEVVDVKDSIEISEVRQPPFLIPPSFSCDSMVEKFVSWRLHQVSSKFNKDSQQEDTTQIIGPIDVILYVYIDGVEVSTGKQAVGAFFSGITGGNASVARSSSLVTFEMYDINSGRVLYSDLSYSKSRFPSADNFIKTIDGLLTKLPSRRKK